MKSLGLVPGCLVQFALLSTVVSTSEPSTNNSINEGLKRNRLDSRELALTALAVAEPAVESISDSLEEIWARETAMAQVEIERALLRLVAASMPHPTAPAPTPVAAPVLVPVAVTTSAPTTCLQNQTPEQYLLNELLKITPVSLLTNPASAQGKAFNFILGDPLVRQNVCTYPTLAQRYGLGTIVTKGRRCWCVILGLGLT